MRDVFAGCGVRRFLVHVEQAGVRRLRGGGGAGACPCVLVLVLVEQAGVLVCVVVVLVLVLACMLCLKVALLEE